MKTCTHCKQVFPMDSFAPRKDRGNKPHSWCNGCRRKRLDAVVKNRRAKQDKVSEIKRARGCCVCGFNEPVALDFHHLDPSTKDDTIAQMFAVHASMERIITEMDKCVVLCANHHRMFHAGLITL